MKLGRVKVGLTCRGPVCLLVSRHIRKERTHEATVILRHSHLAEPRVTLTYIVPRAADLDGAGQDRRPLVTCIKYAMPH